MQINIQVIAVNVERDIPTKNGKSTYDKLTVTFKDQNGKTQAKQVFPFSMAKDQFQALCEMQAGNVYTITQEKGASGYWEWQEVARNDGGMPANDKPTGGYQAPKRDYETAEERAAKQRQIGRAGSINSAIAVLGTGCDKMEMFSLAEEIYSFIADSGVNLPD